MNYDAIVVGARCAGSPTAMLLARRGYKVLIVDRATFPSDTLSTHVLQPRAVASLARWGLLDRLIATGCPAIDTFHFDFGPLAVTGRPGTEDAPVAYCPRRTVLDKLLVDAAVEAGAELREGFAVEELLRDGDRVTGIRGRSGEELTARVVIGADGRHSMVAKAVGAPEYHAAPALQGGYYSYWRDLPTHGRFEFYIRDAHGFAACETHDGLTMVVGGWPFATYDEKRHDHEAAFLSLFDATPAFKARIERATRVDKIYGAATPNLFRTPFGPGWALVGDAGYLKDPITAQGMLDAFRDAELLATGLGEVFSGTRSFEAAMTDYQTARDAIALPMFGFTCQLAAMAPPPPELVALIGAMQHNQPAMDDFCRVNAGSLSPAEFFAEANLARIMAAAA